MIRSSKFSNLTYQDFVECNPLHFNSMRSNPTLPQAVIENNIIQLRPLSYDWQPTSPKHHRPKRCLFSTNQVHLASLSSLTNIHLIGNFPNDHLRKEIGTKKRVTDFRNGIEFKTLGDKSYRDVEYSREFFNRSLKEWRSKLEKHDNTKDLPNEMIPNLKYISLKFFINFK